MQENKSREWYKNWGGGMRYSPWPYPRHQVKNKKWDIIIYATQEKCAHNSDVHGKIDKTERLHYTQTGIATTDSYSHHSLGMEI